ncbi:glycosyltransferase [Rothia kristinae]
MTRTEGATPPETTATETPGCADLPLHVVPGPPEHGVSACALDLAAALGAPVLRVPDGSALDAALPRLAGRRVHLHVTDALFGAGPEEAAERVARVGAACAGLSVTLHDLPQPSDGPRNLPRRRAAYAAIAAAADAGVVVSSRHELALLVEHGTIPAVPGPGGRDPRIAVVPLPLPDPPAPHTARPPAGQALGHPEAADPLDRWLPAGHGPVLGIFGFVYPGKGHEEAIDAAAALVGSPAVPAGPPVVLAVGRTAAGHEEMAETLRERAERRGVIFRITGYVPEPELPAVLGAVDAPLCLHRYLSASGSVNSWIGLGRRPVCADSRYIREMAELRPGSLLPTAPDELVGRLREVLADPGLTRIADPGALPHTRTDAARDYAAFFAPDQPEVTVVIPYYDDGTPDPTPGAAGTLAARRLELLLAALTRQEGVGSVETIVVDDGSPVPPRLPETVVGLRQEDRGFRAGAARTLGARRARGRALAFLDGDTIPDPGYLAALTTPLLAGTAQVTTGRRDHAHLTGPHAGRALESPRWLAQLHERTRDLTGGDARTHQAVISAVLGVSRWTFLAVGGFDESLTGYGGEDWELAHRLWEAGASFRHVPAARAVHDGPDWAARGGREDPEQKAAKNRETRALAVRIPAPWTRPGGVVFPVPQLIADLTGPALDDEGDPSDRVSAWIADLLAAVPDAAVHLPPDIGVPEVLAADPRVRAAPIPRPVQGEPAPRFRLAVRALFDPAGLAGTLRELDAAAEDGPRGGAERRARLLLPGTAQETGDAVVADAVAAELVSARAAALEQAGHPVGTGMAAAVGPYPLSPDLERRWAGW